MPSVDFARDPFEARHLMGDDREAFKAFWRSNSAGNLRVVHRNTAYCINADGPSRAKRRPEDRGTAVDTRLTGFQQALHRYQAALVELREFEARGAHRHTQGRGVAHNRNQLEGAVREAYQDPDQRFRAETDRAVPHANRYKNRGNALSNAERGLTLAHRSAGRKADPRLFVADSIGCDEAGRQSSSKWTRGWSGHAWNCDHSDRLGRHHCQRNRYWCWRWLSWGRSRRERFLLDLRLVRGVVKCWRSLAGWGMLSCPL